jgi:predicted RNA-binding protein
MEDKKHIIKILQKTQGALKKEDYVKIKNLSNRVVHDSSIYQDPDIISIAVIIYSLSKLIEREKYEEYQEWPSFYKNYIRCLDNALKELKNNNIEGFREEINHIRESIEKLSGRLKNYMTEVFRKASINKASRIYEHGISMEKTAKILGISVWELAEYAGQTGIGDVDLSVTMSVRNRIKLAEEIFK